MNTNEIKAKLFALYYGTDCAFANGYERTFPVSTITLNSETEYLQLRDISGLQDDEALNLAGVQFNFFRECAGGKDFNLKVIRELSKISVAAVSDDRKSCLAKIEVSNEWKLNIAGIDYLRSISIAFPFTTVIDGKPVTYSVKEQIDNGWIKIVK